MKSRIAIVDDHPAVAFGTAAIVNSHDKLRMVRSAPTVSSLLATHEQFDLVLLDLQLADSSSLVENVSRLKHLGCPILAYTSGEHTELVRVAARSGVAGMIRKSEIPEVVVQTILDALSGEPILTPDWASALSEDLDFISAELTAREAQVLTLYAAGETAESVAHELFISRETVLDHIRRIRTKYAAVNRPAPTKVDLFRRAVEDGLVSPDS